MFRISFPPNTIRLAAIAAAAAILISAGFSHAQSQTAAAAPAGNVARGKALFNDSYACGSCHGVTGTSGSPRIVPQARSQADFVAYVRKPTGNGMPAFPDATDQQLADVYAYVKSIPTPNPPPAQNIPILNDIIKSIQ
jgi:mono/diheme cytochrome c family protein